MALIKVFKVNELYLRISSERYILQELNGKFSFFVDGYKHMPKYKQGLWDGKISLFNINTRLLPQGLLFDLLKFSKVNNHTIEIENKSAFKRTNFETEIEEFTSQLTNITNKSVSGIYQYQFDSFKHCIQQNKAIVLSPTACMDENTIIDIEFDENIDEFLKTLRT